MSASSDPMLIARTQSKIQFLEDQLVSLEHFLPETYDYLMKELDHQKRLLVELEVHEHYRKVDRHEIPVNTPPA